MLPNDNGSMSVGRLDLVLLNVYSSMEHLTWESLGLLCGWVGRILHPDSCISLSSLNYLFYPSGLSLCLSVDRFSVSQSMTWFSSMALSCEQSTRRGQVVPTDIETLSLGNILQLCRVRSFYITDCTDWMNLFNTKLNIVVHSDSLLHLAVVSTMVFNQCNDKTEWRLISATLCGWKRCFMDDHLCLMKCIREEEEEDHCSVT